MANPQKKKPSGSGGIRQIEGLQLPKRSEKRRAVYLGEHIRCTLIGSNWKTQVDVVDLSHRGTAVVDVKAAKALASRAGEKVQLVFRSGQKGSYTVKGEIVNQVPVRLGDKSYARFGVRFHHQNLASIDAYRAELPKSYTPCKGYVRPQAYARDPFFYDEVILFQVNGFTNDGIELIVSARCKSLIPGQVVVIAIHLPGRGTFNVQVENSELFFRGRGDNRYRIYATFRDPPADFLHAVAEHLVMFGPDVTPKGLRKLGFAVGNLANAIEVNHASLGDDFFENHGFVVTELASPTGMPVKRRAHSRRFTCKLGPHVVASCQLVFVEGKHKRSALVAAGYELPDKLLTAGHVELVDLLVSREAALVDYLIPLLQQIVRVTAQSQSEYILVECSAKIIEVLKKIGFQPLAKTKDRPKKSGERERRHLMVLAVQKVIANNPSVLPLNIWDKIYKRLFDYLQKHPVP